MSRLNYKPVFTIALIILLTVTSCYSADNAFDGLDSSISNMYCPDLKPQPSLDLEQIMGKWHVVEVMEHKVNPMRLMSSGHIVVETCPTVRLRFTGRTSLRLLWTTEEGDLDYSFSVPDLDKVPGFWVSRDLQNGTLLTKDYIHFVGVVQVMKAVASHMVLTFCSRTPDNQLYSLLLSRKHNLPKNDATGVQNLLSRRGLAMVSVKETCINAESGKESSNVTRWMNFATISIAIFAVFALNPIATTVSSLSFNLF